MHQRYEAIVERTQGGEIYRMREIATGITYSVAEYVRIVRRVEECGCHSRYTPCRHEVEGQSFVQGLVLAG